MKRISYVRLIFKIDNDIITAFVDYLHFKISHFKDFKTIYLTPLQLFENFSINVSCAET